MSDAAIPIAVIEDDLLELVAPFIERQLAEMERALCLAHTGELDEVRHIGHRLKGTAGSLGLAHMAHLGEAIEGAARANDVGAVIEAATEASRVMRVSRFIARSNAPA